LSTVYLFANNTSAKGGSASGRKVDSLLQALQTAKHDTTKINTLNTLASEICNNQPDKALVYAKNALELSKELDFTRGMAASYNNIARVFWMQGNYPKSLKNLHEKLNIYNELKDKKGIASSLGNIGSVYWNQGDYPKALKYYFKALKMDEELGNKNGIARHLGNIGVVYENQGDYPKALEYYFKSLKMKEELDDKRGIAIDLGNIGIVYYYQGDYSKVLEYFFKALKMRQELGNKSLIAIQLGNIGIVYKDQGDLSTDNSVRQVNYSKALEYYSKALKMRQELGAKSLIASTLGNIGALYTEQKKYPEAERYLLRALEIADSIGALNHKMQLENSISKLYVKWAEASDRSKRSDAYKKAYEHHIEYSIAKDSLFNEEKSKEIGKLEAGFEYDKKLALEQAEHSKQSAVAASESKRQKVVIYAVSGGLLLVVMFLILLFNRFRIKQKANIELKAKNEIIEKQKNNIIDSIDYAKRIQQSILIPEHEIQKHLPESFIYYQPKDIVSGDFYWFSHQNGKSIIAAVDCTGHGVPGAFMSMIGNTLLNEIVNEKQITEPAVILSELHSAILNTLQQEGEDAQSQDGMDMALCIIDQENNLIWFAGAMNPLYIIRNGTLEMIKADIYSIGGKSYMSGKEVEPKFTGHEIPIEKNMVIYMFSDGYMDQFGGEPRKTFSSQGFKQLLLDNSKLKMHQQKAALGKTMEDWKGSYEQIDDMLVMGVRF